MTQLNPRAVIGDNQDVDQAQIVSDRLTALYYPSDQSLDKLLGEMPNMPEDVSSDADALMLGALIKNLRDLDNSLKPSVRPRNSRSCVVATLSILTFSADVTRSHAAARVIVP